MSEWTKEYAWRAYVPSNRNRGFESHPLRRPTCRRDSKPANADPREEEHWRCGSERAGSEALGVKGRAEEESHPLRVPLRGIEIRNSKIEIRFRIWNRSNF